MMGYKEYSDSYLMKMTKKEIIAQLRVAEHNFRAEEQNLNQQIENVKDWQPVKHGQWTKISETGMYHIYKCSVCKRIINVPFNPDLTGIDIKNLNNENEIKLISDIYPYCHCGARMDGDEQ